MSDEAGNEGKGAQSGDAALFASMKTLITDVRVVGAAVFLLFGGGWLALAKVQDSATEVARREIGSIDTRLRAVEQRLEADASVTNFRFDQLQVEVRETRVETKGLREDLRQLFPLLRKADGGQ
jgi:hypothetical protein